MPRNKVIYGDEVLIDLTGDTVTADTLAEGVTAHDAAGNPIIGTMMAQSGGGTTLTVTTNEGATVTVTNGSESYTGVGPVAVFEGLVAGTWTVTATLGDASTSKTVEIGAKAVEVPAYRIYGIRRRTGTSIAASSPDWTRTDDAVGLTASAAVGTVATHNDFDNCYPWSEIKRETFPTGDVMVKIPKFYFRRYQEGDTEYIKIASSAVSGFTLHPLFNHGGVESEYAYVGAYKTSSNNKSVAGASPQGGQSRPTMRNNAKAKGTGWGLIDIAALSAIQMLFLVEYATNNAQAAIGRGYCDDNTAAITTGSCDSVPNLTGRPTGTDGKTDVVWRGIEGLWGNLWEIVDGINYNGGRYYVCNDPSKYADDTATNYTQLSFTVPTNLNTSYITQEGIDDGDNTHVMLPSAAGGGGESSYFCDACWTSTGWKMCIVSGNRNSGSICGLFTANLYDSASGTDTNVGSRLLYIPS